MRKAREKAEAEQSAAADFIEPRCFVLSAGSEYKRRERAEHCCVALHVKPSGGDALHPALAWAPLAAELFRTGAARQLFVLDGGDFAAELEREASAAGLGRAAKPLARLWAKLNARDATVCTASAEATALALKLLPGTSQPAACRCLPTSHVSPHSSASAGLQCWSRRWCS